MADSLLLHNSAEDCYNQAVEHFKQSDYQASIACCNQAIAVDPNHVNAWCLRAQTFQELGDDESAFHSFERVIALDPEVYQVWERRSLTLINLGRSEEALESVDRAIALMPEDSQDWLPYYNRGCWLCMLERHNEATASFEKAAAIASAVSSSDPDDLSVVWSTLGNHYTDLEHYEQAIVAYENAPYVRIEDTEDRWLYALIQLGRQDQILAQYNHLVEAEPDSDVAWKRRGLAMQKLGRLEEAINSYKRVVALNPSCTVWYYLQEALEQLGRQTEILDCYKEVLAIYPDRAELWAGQAYSLSQLGRKEEALASYEQAISLGLNGDYADYDWHGYAILLQEFGRVEQAIEALRQAATIAPMPSRTRDYWCDLGNIFFEMERYETALEYYDRSPSLRYDGEINRIQALTALGRLDDVVAQFDRQLKDCPDERQMWIDRGRVLEQLGQIEAANDSYNQALALNPDNWNALLSCGYLLFYLERNEEAIAVFERMIELNPNDAVAYYNKACCYVYTKQFDIALQNLQRAIELDSTCRQSATTDAAFAQLHEDERFRSLAG